jgi:hypothetical protein
MENLEICVILVREKRNYETIGGQVREKEELRKGLIPLHEKVNRERCGIPFSHKKNQEGCRRLLLICEEAKNQGELTN